jgi:hypothetical protein
MEEHTAYTIVKLEEYTTGGEIYSNTQKKRSY